MNRQSDRFFSIIVCGGTETGKTSIIKKYINGDITTPPPTIGVEFFTKILNYEEESIKIHIWDLSGQRRFQTISSVYLTKADIVVIVYDIQNPQIEDLKFWLDKTKDIKSKIPIVIVGNKIDLTTSPTILERYSKHKINVIDEIKNVDEVIALVECSSIVQEECQNCLSTNLFDSIIMMLIERQKKSIVPLEISLSKDCRISSSSSSSITSDLASSAKRCIYRYAESDKERFVESDVGIGDDSPLCCSIL